VRPEAGGSDHYFTVVRPEGGGDPFIVDGTWKQFCNGGTELGECLAGTLSQLARALSKTKLNIDLVGLYAAGAQVINDWDNYSCFSDT
jgi:hypothetical protein